MPELSTADQIRDIILEAEPRESWYETTEESDAAVQRDLDRYDRIVALLFPEGIADAV